MLSDSCFDFNDTTDDAPSKAAIAEAIADFRDGIEHYSDFGYEPTALNLLRYSLSEFESGALDLAKLRAVVGAEQRWFDTPPSRLTVSFLDFVLEEASPAIDRQWLDAMLAWQDQQLAITT